MPCKLIAVSGARPNFMKLAPLMRVLRGHPDFTTVLVHTGQHYDHQMSGQFFGDLELPEPDFNLEVGSGSHAQQTAEIIKRFEPVMLQERPAGVIVVGDVNSTMACALVAAKLGSPVVHVEAGLRSHDRSMPEEINRVVADAVSDLLLVTEKSGRENLLAEGIPAERIHVVGNLMVDSLRYNLERARRSDIATRLALDGLRFGLVTLHRPSNVDEPEQLAQILATLSVIAEDLPLLFPVHPRTRARIQADGFTPDNRIQILEPLGYLDFLCLMSRSWVVLTDSGGIQEETTALGIPCLTLRNNTERPVTIEEGTNILAGVSKNTILEAWRQTKRCPKAGRIPELWDGNAAGRCLKVLQSHFVA